MMVDRKKEIRELLKLSPEEVIERAGKHLIVCEDLDKLHQHFAESIASEIKKNNQQNKPTRLILPVGPVGQYPILARIINEENISLKYCWFFFMDEYCDDQGKILPSHHPLSFKGIIEKEFLNLLEAGDLSFYKRLFFPNENNLEKLANLIDEIGGIDTCHGGIGIHGHLAFNEPEPKIAEKGFRKVKLNDFTITINAIRANVGGNLENFPRYAFTIGMKQILNSLKIRLYCRNGTPYDWANAILRIALFSQPGDDYPVTYIRNHEDHTIMTDKDTLQTPKNLL